MAPPTKQEMIDAAIAAYETGEWGEWLKWMGERRVVARVGETFEATKVYDIHQRVTTGSTGTATEIVIDARPRFPCTLARKIA